MKYLIVFDSSIKEWKKKVLDTLEKNSYRLKEIRDLEKDKEGFFENYLNYKFIDYKNEIVTIKFCSLEDFKSILKEKELCNYKKIFFQERLIKPFSFFKELSETAKNYWVIGDGINFIMKLDYFLSDEKIED